MFYNYYQSDEYQFDSCSAKGICSSMPVGNSLQEVVTIYLKNIAYYTLKLKDLGVSNNSIRGSYLNIFSGLISGTDYLEDNYEQTLYSLYEIYLESKQMYKKISQNKNLELGELKNNIKITKSFDINKIIRYGEKEFGKRVKILKPRIKNLLEMSFFVAKSLCVNALLVQSFTDDIDEAYHSILSLFNVMNNSSVTEGDIIKLLRECAIVDYKYNQKLLDLYKEYYGNPEPTMVPFSTRQNKAILVTGNNFKELELLLEEVKGTDIDVYTHGAMLLALMYPKFKEYPNLRGQFGVGSENCLLDFATFPGAILMTRLSLQNLDYLYRGRLFTTDVTAPKGVVKITNKDFSKVIKAAKEAKGFSKGQQRPDMPVGYFTQDLLAHVDTIIEKFHNDELDYVFLIGNYSTNSVQNKYFDKLLKLKPKRCGIISFNCDSQKKTVFQMNTCYDFMLVYEVLRKLSEQCGLKNLNIQLFLTKCDLHTISNTLNLKFQGVKNIFMPSCSPKLINPSVVSTLRNVFRINPMTNPEYDMSLIIKK